MKTKFQPSAEVVGLAWLMAGQQLFCPACELPVQLEPWTTTLASHSWSEAKIINYYLNWKCNFLYLCPPVGWFVLENQENNKNFFEGGGLIKKKYFSSLTIYIQQMDIQLD